METNSIILDSDVTMFASALLLLAAQRPGVPPIGPVDLPLGDPIFAYVDRLGADADLAPLRKRPLPGDDLEVRVWHGFSWGTGVVRLARCSGAWHVERSVDRDRPERRKWSTFGLDPVPAPKGGWAEVWRTLDALGIRTIPDEASLPDDGQRVFDGRKVLVEIRTGPTYRAYTYDNPEDHPKKRYAPAVAKILRVLARAMPDGLLSPRRSSS